MSQAKVHTLHLTNGAAEALKAVLSSPGWYDNASLAYRAGQILEMPELDLSAPPIEEAAALWRKEPCPLELTEKLRDTVKHCVDHYVKKGAFTINAHSMALMREAGLAPED